MTAGLVERADLLRLSARDPDRPRDRGRGRRAAAVPARPRRAVRRPARARVSSRCSPAGPSARGCPDDRHRPDRGPDRADRDRRGRSSRSPSSPTSRSSARPRTCVPVVVVALGLLGGGVVGAVCGFAAGLLLDSVLLQTLGVSSLVLLLDRLPRRPLPRGLRDHAAAASRRCSPARFTLLGAAGFAAIELMLGVDAAGQPAGRARDPRPGRCSRSCSRFGVYPLVRRVLRPALVDDTPAPAPPARRRSPPAPRRPRAAAAVEHSARRRPASRRAPIHGGRRMMGRDWRGPPMPGPVRAAGRDPRRRSAWSRSRSSSCASGTSRCSRATSTWPQAQNNQVREFTVQAPRGEIVDRHGEVLVDNRTALELQVKPTELPREHASAARGCSSALGEVAGLRPEQIRKKIRAEAKECAGVPGDPAPRRRLRHRLLPAREPGATSPASRSSASTCAATRRGRSPRTCSATWARSTDQQLEDPRYEALEPGDQVGKDGRRVHLRQPPARHQRRDPGPGRRRRASPPAASSPSASRRPATTSC